MSLPPLHTAALNCELDELVRLIDSGVDVNSRDDDGQTALFCAAQGDMFIWNPLGSEKQEKEYKKLHRQYMEIAEHLIKNGADVDATANSGMTVIDTARALGNAAFVQLLESHGATLSVAKRRSLWDRVLGR